MSLIANNTSSEVEASSVAANGFKSSPNIDFTFLDWEVIADMAAELQNKCDEYGGAYPRNNWKLGSVDSHLNSLVQHYAASQAQIGDKHEHLLHICIRAMFAYSVFLKQQQGN
jgi:hypothetical protein